MLSRDDEYINKFSKKTWRTEATLEA